MIWIPTTREQPNTRLLAYWQGDKDRYNTGHATRYEKNLVALIKALRKEFGAPNAKFVCATRPDR